MKKAALFLLTVIMAIPLTACMLVNGGGGKVEGDGHIYSPSLPVSLIVSDDGADPYVATEYVGLYNFLCNMDIQVTRRTDATEENGSEIALGRTGREASVYAYGRIDGAYKSGNITYCICYKGATLAIAAADEASFSEAMKHFYREFATGSTLSVDKSLDVFVNISAEEYSAQLLAEKRAQELADFENRYDGISSAVSGEALAALQRFDSEYCGEEIYEWIAGLYDPKTGAIYYADSARAYEGFLPDLESTYQAYGIIRNSGMLEIYKDAYGGDTGKTIVNMLPRGAKESLTSWVQSMESERDGYFYHPQWGESIGTSRRGRDLDWAISLLGWLDAKPLYPTALDRLGGVSATSAVARVVAAQSAMPEYLQSEEAYLSWLEDKCLKNDAILRDSHSIGHEISSMTSQIKAAGLGEVTVEFFDGIQHQIFLEMQAAYEADPVNNPRPTGLWQKTADYTSISGFYKIALMYSSFGYGMNYLDYVLESSFECIMLDVTATNIVYVFNPWATMNNVFSAMTRSNRIAVKAGEAEPYDIDAAHGIVSERCAELVNKTVDKLAAFYKGNSFSYYPDGSAAYTQGTWVSMGVSEGDVNATMLSMSSLRNAIYACLGLDKPAIWNSTDLDKFLEMIGDAGEIVKTPNNNEIYFDFEQYDEGDSVNGINGDSGVVLDPTDSENKALSFSTDAGTSRSAYIMTNFGDNYGYAYFEADLMVTKGSGMTHQLEFRGTSVSYMTTLSVNGEFVKVGDINNRNAPVVQDTGIWFSVGEWYRLRIEIYTFEDSVKVKCYTLDEDGEYVCRYISDNFYGSDIPDALPYIFTWITSSLPTARQATNARPIMQGRRTVILRGRI